MPLLHEKRGHVAIITLSRPEARNAWGDDYNAGLKELLPALEEDRDIRVVILTGDEAGGAFSAGANIKNPKTHTTASIADFIEDLPRRRRYQAMNLITDFSKPIIAAVNGYAVGIGCIVTYCCDLMSPRKWPNGGCRKWASASCRRKAARCVSRAGSGAASRCASRWAFR